ncbi:hypothetical protein P3T76_012979 [Phytophthora citrophthora]|uniref:WW domain-containing protein n=1 Tax=Phytophthora citrophthora TaxID=4793 RepID=A0AAD9G4S1_9STRA|nr:hypothetical protein P3T76_012979 [Phytophthora citrophthora]
MRSSVREDKTKKVSPSATSVSKATGELMSSRQGEWQRVQDAQGRYFYVNHATREVRLRLARGSMLLPGF